MAPFQQQEAMNRFGAILPYNIPGRKPFTTLWAQKPSSWTWPKYGFAIRSLRVAMPTPAERNGNTLHSHHEYLWIGLLPADADDYNTSRACREVVKTKRAEENERIKTWNADVWKRMDLSERREWSKEDKENARLDGAIDTRCVLDEDKYALRVVARVPRTAGDASFGGGVQFYVLGRNYSEIDSPLCDARVINKEAVFYFEEFHSEATNEKCRSADFVAKVRDKLMEMARASTEAVDPGLDESSSEPRVKVEGE